MYDFLTLQETIEREMPSLKRDVLILALSNVCRSVIHKKKEVFSSQINYYALLSAGVAAVPVPGLSIAADVGMLVSVLLTYVYGFGLDKKSLEKLSSDTKTPLADLMKVMKCGLFGNNVTKALVVKMLSSISALVALLAVEEGSRLIPIVGLLVAAPISAITMYKFLSDTLDKLSVDAENVLKAALGI